MSTVPAKPTAAEARSDLKRALVSLQASPVFGFTRWKYFIGVVKSYLTLYIFGAFPQYFYVWHAFQFAVLTPVHAYRWAKLKSLAYFAEFCWVANAAISLYLIALAGAPQLFDPATRGIMYRLIFAFGAGPLNGSVVLLANALVPHSIDHTMSLLIHLSPALTAYCLRWCTSRPPRRPGLPSRTTHGIDSPFCHARRRRPRSALSDPLFPHELVPFAAYARPPLVFLATWAAAHAVFMLAFGPALLREGYPTTYHYNLRGTTMFTKVLGTVGDGRSETARGRARHHGRTFPQTHRTHGPREAGAPAPSPHSPRRGRPAS